MSIYLILLILLALIFLAQVFKCFTKDYWKNTLIKTNFGSFFRSLSLGLGFFLLLTAGQYVLEEYTSFGSYHFIEWGSQSTETTSLELNDSGDIVKTDSDGVSEIIGFSHWGLRKVASILCLFMILYMMPKISRSFSHSVEYKNKIRPASFIIAFVIFSLLGVSVAGTLVWLLTYLLWDLMALRFYNNNHEKHESRSEFQKSYENWFSPIFTWSGNFFIISFIVFLMAIMGAS